MIGNPIPDEWLTVLNATRTNATSSVAPSNEIKSKH